MTKAIIFHGYQSHPDSNWFRWLKHELEALKVEAHVPKFPTPELQSVNNWLKILENYQPIDKDTILIGHSLGASFILSVLEKYPAKSAYLIAAPFGLLHTELDTHLADFTNKAFDWSAIKANCQDFHLYYSDTDPYVPMAHGEKLAKNLGIPFQKVQGSGHFTFQSFPRLLADVKKDIQ